MANDKKPPEIAWSENIGEADRAELTGLLAAYDDAVEQFQNDTIIFRSDAERKRLFFGFLKRWAKAWSKPGPCVHDGCFMPKYRSSTWNANCQNQITSKTTAHYHAPVQLNSRSTEGLLGIRVFML